LVEAYDAHPAPERLLLRKETYVVQPSSADTPICTRWRVEAFGDVLEASFEAERNSLVAFTSARTLAGKATKLEVLPEADAMHTLLESRGARV
jgi:hypothetical protein